MENQFTPHFDKALKKYYSDLKLDKKGGQERTCPLSGEKFYIAKEDINFYKRISVPLPTLSPHERMRRKLAWLNVYHLFYGQSDLNKKQIISSYPADTPYKIYEHTAWNDADFSNLAQNYDPKKKFFEQYKSFQLAVPRPNLAIRNGVNSDYTHTVLNSKNCYLVFDSENAEDCQFSGFVTDSKNCYHCFATTKSNICYDCMQCKKMYKCFFCEFSKDCVDSSFLFDCRNCHNCFMCTNLRHKKFCFLNEQLSKKEYEEKVSKFNLGDRNELKKYKQQFAELKKQAVHRAHHSEKSVNSSGDYNWGCKNCQVSFYSEDSENLKYVIAGIEAKDSLDSAVFLEGELVYESIPWEENFYNIKFCGKSSNLRDSEYCDLCRNCHDCFACIGLKNKSFHIFNKPYEEEEYWEKVDEIKTLMLKDEEYGEFFPPQLSPFPYQITSASSYQGYDDIETAKKYGYRVEEFPQNIQRGGGHKLLAEDVPTDIKQVDDGILEEVLVDMKNDKRFKYTKEQLAFHRQYNLALPTEYHSAVLARKRIQLGPIDFKYRERKCFKCKKNTQVTFPEDHPDAPEKVYCEPCYNRTVN